MAEIVQIVGLLSEFADREHYVVDVRSAMKKLDNPLEDLEKVLSDPSVSEWHYYALEGLRSIAAESDLSVQDSRIIMEGTKRIAQQYGIDEFYKSIDALALSSQNVSTLVDFANDLLELHDQRDWLWLAFSTAGTVLQHWPDAMTDELSGRLIAAFDEQPESPRREQMAEIVQTITQLRRGAPAGL